MWSASCCVGKMENTSNNKYEDDLTFKSYYFPRTPPSADCEESTLRIQESPRKRERSSDDLSIDNFFDVEKRSKKPKKMSSLVGRAASGGMSYIATNTDDIAHATHLIKIEIHDVKKISKLPLEQHWKHADLRLKYYAHASTNKQFKKAKDLIYNITKEIAESKDSKKFFFNDDNN